MKNKIFIIISLTSILLIGLFVIIIMKEKSNKKWYGL